VDACPVKPDGIADICALTKTGVISATAGKEVFALMCETGKKAAEIVKEKGLVQISDEGALTGVVEKVIAGNPQSVDDYRAGKKKAIGFLVGQVMKETKGKANPQLVNRLLEEKLKEGR
jgi:aspartyl-tRNA(Asn)/glutamyl-tRNA(Gln) amidotransferase subunit B